jgi:hypothetical protein
LFVVVTKEPDKNSAEGVLHNRAERTKDASLSLISVHTGTKIDSWGELSRHPSSRLNTSQNMGEGKKVKTISKPAKLQVYNYIHKVKALTGNRVYVGRGCVCVGG